jgi:hypothetical protein
VFQGAVRHSPLNDTRTCHCEGAPFAPEAISPVGQGDCFAAARSDKIGVISSRVVCGNLPFMSMEIPSLRS